jgi:hypothetical protein
MTAEIDTIARRVRKLLALAGDRGATSDEAASALSMAHALIARHNLEMAALEEETGAVGGKVEREVHTFQQSQWVRILAHGVARAHFCGSAYSGSKIWFYGRPENIAVAVEITRWIVTQLKAEQARARREYAEQHDWVPSGWTNSFFIAAVRVVCNRLYALGKAEEGSTALVRTDRMLEVRAAMTDTRKAAPYRVRMAPGAREAGMAAGGRVRLDTNDHLGGAKTRLALG